MRVLLVVTNHYRGEYMKHRNYLVVYQSNGEKIDELYSTIEMIIIFIIANFKKDFEIIEVKRCEFCD